MRIFVSWNSFGFWLCVFDLVNLNKFVGVEEEFSVIRIYLFDGNF